MGLVSYKTISFRNNPKLGFIGVILLFALLIGSVIGLYIVGSKFMSSVYAQRAFVVATTEGDIKKAEENINKAVLFDTNDRVYRAASEIALVQISQLIAQNENTPEIQNEFQRALTLAVQNAQLAVNVDNKNYQNWTKKSTGFLEW